MGSVNPANPGSRVLANEQHPASSIVATASTMGACRVSRVACRSIRALTILFASAMGRRASAPPLKGVEAAANAAALSERASMARGRRWIYLRVIGARASRYGESVGTTT